MANVVTDVLKRGDEWTVIVTTTEGKEVRYPVIATDPNAASTLHDLANKTKKGDPVRQSNEALIKKGFVLDDSDKPPIEPPPPTEDELAVREFTQLFKVYKVDTVKEKLTKDPNALELVDMYNSATETQQALFDNVLFFLA